MHTSGLQWVAIETAQHLTRAAFVWGFAIGAGLGGAVGGALVWLIVAVAQS